MFGAEWTLSLIALLAGVTAIGLIVTDRLRRGAGVAGAGMMLGGISAAVSSEWWLAASFGVVLCAGAGVALARWRRWSW